MSQPRRYAFEYWDVFTKHPLQGNPLCVFLHAGTLTDTEMQALARETNLSETTFVLPGNRIRIWTPVEEYPFAGHPTLGTAMALRTPGMKKIVLQEKIGPVPVDFEEHAGGLTYAEMLQPEPVFAEEHKREDIAPLFNLAPADIVGPVQNISTGRPNLIVPVQSVKTLQPDWPRIKAYLSAGDTQRGFYFVTRAFEARKLTPRLEDPATGSAAGCAAAYFVKQGWAKPGERVTIRQGAEVGRPSELFVSAAESTVRVGGYSVKSMTGEISL